MKPRFSREATISIGTGASFFAAARDGAGAVLGPVVDGDELEVPVRLGEEGGQEAFGVAGLVVRDEGDEDARHSGPPRQERALPSEAEEALQDADVGARGLGTRVVSPDDGKEREAQERTRRENGAGAGADREPRVPAEVPEEVPRVERKVVVVGERAHRGAADVARASRGDEADTVPRFEDLRAEVDVLEPGGGEGGVEASDLGEDRSADEERGGRGLLHVERDAPVPVEVALAEEPPVPREEAVHEEGFPGERAERGEAPELERFLSVPLERRGGRGNSRVGVELGEEGRERGRAVEEGGVGVEEEERLRGREAATSPAPTLHAGPKPVFSPSRTTTAPARSASPAEPSSEALSTTTTRAGAGIDAAARPTSPSEFQETTTALTRERSAAGRARPALIREAPSAAARHGARPGPPARSRAGRGRPRPPPAERPRQPTSRTASRRAGSGRG